MKSFLKFMFKPAQGAFLLATSLLCIAGLTISFFSTSERTFIGILVALCNPCRGHIRRLMARLSKLSFYCATAATLERT